MSYFYDQIKMMFFFISLATVCSVVRRFVIIAVEMMAVFVMRLLIRGSGRRAKCFDAVQVRIMTNMSLCSGGTK